MLKKDADRIVGGLTYTGKMPCPSYSISAKRCMLGTTLATVKGSICSKCYALKGRYVFPVVQAALERRYAKLMGALRNPIERIRFVYAFQTLLAGHNFFRWHDSGDLQSVEHLDLISTIAQLTPDTIHWLPTREVKIVREYQKLAAIPPNLRIRLSSTMIGQAPLKWEGKYTSTVHATTVTAPVGKLCDAYTRGGKCGPCRACWDPSVLNVSYPFH